MDITIRPHADQLAQDRNKQRMYTADSQSLLMRKPRVKRVKILDKHSGLCAGKAN